MKNIIVSALVGAVAALLAVLVYGLVSDNQTVAIGADVANTRYPNGINVTADGCYAVDGTCVIDSSGNYDGAVTATTGTFSSTLTYLEKTTSLSANSSTTNAMSGTTFYINTTGSTTTLPAVGTATGTVYRWVVGSAFDTHDFTINSAEGDNIEGSMIVAGAVVDCDANDKIKFVVDGENLGDFVQLRSNGQKWYVTESNALTAAKLTCDG